MVIWATESWDDYTERDGTGFYHDLMALMFQDMPINLVVRYMPWKQALRMVRQGRADTTGVEEYTEGFLASDIPLFFVVDAVLIRKSRLREWTGPHSLSGLKGVSFLGASNNSVVKKHLKVLEVNDRKQAMTMLLQRSDIDFYYDNYDQLTLVMEKIGLTPNTDGFELHHFRSGEQYWLFAPTVTGAAFKAVFDRQFKLAYCNGTLLRLYQRWNLAGEYPHGALAC